MRLFLLIAPVLLAALAAGCVNLQTGAHGYPLCPVDDAAISRARVEGKLIWPVDCTPGVDCMVLYPDIDGNGNSGCGSVGYAGHTGTDIAIGNEITDGWTRMDKGVAVRAAADGEVLWVFDGKYDRCENLMLTLELSGNSDCAEPKEKPSPGSSDGYRVCTDKGPYCRHDNPNSLCVWCFAGGNVVVIKHDMASGVFATRYDHLKNGSILVRPGDHVSAGQKIAEIGSAGRSEGPHLHFEVWTDYYTPDDPWSQSCGSDGSRWLYAEQANAPLH
jgi:murein DD-endopeptidase MepM/ murein hydrolase activator NlpD